MITVTRDNAVEFETHRWTTDASDLGLPPGCFPQTLKTTLGNKRNFYAHRFEVFGDYDEVVWVDYCQELGCITLRIHND